MVVDGKVTLMECGRLDVRIGALLSTKPFQRKQLSHCSALK